MGTGRGKAEGGVNLTDLLFSQNCSSIGDCVDEHAACSVAGVDR